MARRRKVERSQASIRKALKVALTLFSRQGYRATSMRQIAARSGMSVGNLYHHFRSKDAIFQRLIDQYWLELLDPELPLNQVFREANFPDDLEEMAAAIEDVVRAHPENILLIYVDVIEFRGKHIRAFYDTMAERFRRAYSRSFDEMSRDGRLGEVNPLVAVMAATRWLFYYYTVEHCFGVPMHFGMDTQQAVHEFIRILRYGVLARPLSAGGDAEANPTNQVPG